MKKKITSLLLAATAVAASFCLAACGDDGKGGNDDAKIKDAEAWVAAFDFRGVENATWLEHSTADTEPRPEHDVYMFDVNAICEIIGEGEYERTEYERYDIDGGKLYSYEYDKECEKWVYSVRDLNDGDEVYTIDDRMNNIRELLGTAEMFANFEYDAKKGVYNMKASALEQLEAETTHVYVSIECTFKKSKFSEMYIRSTYGDGEVFHETNQIRIYDIGTTMFTIPVATEKDHWHSGF